MKRPMLMLLFCVSRIHRAGPGERMKKKKRKPVSDRSSSAENHNGLAMQQTQAYANRDKMHVLSIIDELDGYLAPYAPEIHRWHIPAAAAGERGQLFRKGVCYLNNVPGTSTLNPKPCGTELVEAGGFCGDGDGRLLPGLDLTLSPGALKGPSPDFVEGFQKLLEVKVGIMALRIRHGLDAWSLGSHMVNPFEVLSFVAATSPLNRAFFKMWELTQIFQLVPSVSKKQRFLSAHLCEGPGGFIESVQEYRARSSISEEHNQDILKVVDEDLHTKDSSLPPANKTQAHPVPAGPFRCSKLNGGIEELSSRSTLSDESDATDCLEDLLLNESDGNVDSPRTQSGSPCAVERSGVQVNNTLSISGDLKANLRLKKCSSTHSSAQEDQLFELGRVDSKDVEQFDISCETTPYAVGGKDAFMGPCTHHHSAAVRGEDSADNNCRSLKEVSMHYHDLWFGLTLASTQQCASGGSLPPPIMEMTRLNKKKAAANSEGHLHFGVDGSGDLTNPANLNAFVEYTLGCSEGQRMDLITADGAFDVSEDFSSQEHSHLNLVFCEVVAALRLQAEGGSFVLKLFDCFTSSTLTILFILSSLYRNVEIVRLRTTRVCNSERYVVAEGFLGLSPQLEDILLRLNEEWNIASLRGDKVGLLLSRGYPEQLLQAVMESNAVISATQTDGITRGLQLADVIGERLPKSDSFGKRKGFISMLRRKLQTQKRLQRNAIALCKELNIPCRSQFCVE